MHSYNYAYMNGAGLAGLFQTYLCLCYTQGTVIRIAAGAAHSALLFVAKDEDEELDDAQLLGDDELCII